MSDVDQQLITKQDIDSCVNRLVGQKRFDAIYKMVRSSHNTEKKQRPSISVVYGGIMDDKPTNNTGNKVDNNIVDNKQV